MGTHPECLVCYRTLQTTPSDARPSPRRKKQRLERAREAAMRYLVQPASTHQLHSAGQPNLHAHLCPGVERRCQFAGASGVCQVGLYPLHSLFSSGIVSSSAVVYAALRLLVCWAFPASALVSGVGRVPCLRASPSESSCARVCSDVTPAT